jgi:CDP-paratose 2-epimerase
MNIIVTGGAGFVGSNLALGLKALYPSVHIIAADNLVRRGSELNLSVIQKAGVQFMHVDVRIPDDIRDLPPAEFIIDASADPSVLSGINSSVSKLVSNNLIGTVNLLEHAVQHKSKFIFLSTSRVYPYDRLNEISLIEQNLRFVPGIKQVLSGISNEGVSEDFPLSGVRSFYGTAKLSSELFIREYSELKGIESIILRCGVIAGPGQFGKVDQGVLVFWLARHFWKGKLSYFGYGGTGKQVRDFLHVHDLLSLTNIIIGDFARFRNHTFNAGGGLQNAISLAELTQMCEKITGNHIDIGSVAEDRVADIPYYVTDNGLINSMSGWKPSRDMEAIVHDTFEWMKRNEGQLKSILL